MEDIGKLDKKLDVLGKILSLTFKLGVVLGSAVLLFYCWRIGYFPQDVAIGDGLLFILLVFHLCCANGVMANTLWSALPWGIISQQGCTCPRIGMC